MPKNYTIDYLSALHSMLEQEADSITSLIEEKDNGEPDMPSEAKTNIKPVVSSIQGKLIEFKQDIRNLKYSEFKAKYLN